MIALSIGCTLYTPQKKKKKCSWSSEHVRTAVNSGVNLFKHKEEALISNHPSLITGRSGRHVTPPPPQPMWAVATEGRFSARSPTTTSSLCVNKRQALNFSCTLKKTTLISFSFTVVWLRNPLIYIIIWLLTCSQISASLESFRVFLHCKIATGGARLREKTLSLLLCLFFDLEESCFILCQHM